MSLSARSLPAIASPMALAALALPAQAADDDPELAFNNHCRECHSAIKDDNRLGPSLYGVVGRKAGSLASYDNYSPALKGTDFSWTPAVLDQWIANPSALAPGNNMQPPYPGVDDAAERAKIIAYLKSLTQPGAAEAGKP